MISLGTFTAAELDVLEDGHLAHLLEEGAPTDPGRPPDTPRPDGGSGAGHGADQVIPEGDPAGGESDERDLARLEEARSSLIARGLLELDGSSRPTGEHGHLLQVALDLRLCGASEVITLRRITGPPADATVEDVAGHQDITRLMHLTPFGAGVEDVHGDFHHLSLALDTESQVEAVTTFLLPHDAVDGTGAGVQSPTTGPGETVGEVEHMLTLLHHPTVLAEISRLVAHGEDYRLQESHLLALGPGGCFLRSRDLQSAATAHGTLFAPVSTGWVTTWIEELVAEVDHDEHRAEWTV